MAVPSQNFEIPQGANRESVSTENESNSMAGNFDRKELELSTDMTNVEENEVNATEKLMEHSGSNSDESRSDSPSTNGVRKRRRRRRTRKRKVTEPEDTYDNSTTDPDANSTTSTDIPKSPSDTTCSSCSYEDTEVEQGSGDEFIVEESDSAISQDETYQDLITEQFVLDLEQRIIKENLFIEHEKLTNEVAGLASKLNAQLEKSVAMEQSLKELKSDNGLLQTQKSELWNDVKTKEDEIAALKEEAISLKAKCDSLSEGQENEIKASYIELDKLKSQLIMKEEELQFVKRKNDNEYKELAKNHGLFLAQILTEAQEMNVILYTALRNCAKAKPEIRKTNNVLQLLKQLKQDIEFLSERSSHLEITIKQLREEIVNQSKTLMKFTKEKRFLNDEIVERNKQNKSLIKDKAKLEREKETLKKDAARAKNSSQTLKVRLEELKANVRSAKRENEVVLREKQNVEMTLKSLGIDYKAVLSKSNAIMDSEENDNQSNGHVDPETDSPKIAPGPPKIAPVRPEETVMRTEEQPTDLNTGLANHEPATGSVIQGQVSKEVQEHDPSLTSERSCELDDTVAKLTKDGFCLKRITKFLADGLMNVEVFVQEMHCNCGCYQDEAAQRQFLRNFPFLARWVPRRDALEASIEKRMSEIKTKWQIDTKMAEDLREELTDVRRENSLLKSERDKQDRSLEGYKELIRGYSHMVNRAQEERVPGFREMRCINHELEKYATLLEKQKEGLGARPLRVFEGINLIHAMYQRLKSFAGKLFKVETRNPSSESMEQVSLKNLEQANKCLQDKLAISERHVSLLKVNLGMKRGQAIDIQIKIHTVLFGYEQRPAFEPPEQKTCKKAKGNGLRNFMMKRKGENDQGKVESNSAFLSEKQLAVVIDLVQVKQQMVIGIKESMDLEKRLDRLFKDSREYMDILEGEDTSFEESKTASESADSKGTLELLKCLKEKERIENEFSFNEAYIQLLERQIGLLKSERKVCLKALKKYQEEMKGLHPNSTVAALARLLSACSTSDEGNFDIEEERVSSNCDGASGSGALGLGFSKNGGLSHGAKTTATGLSSNV